MVKVAPRVWAVTGYSLNNYIFIEGDTGLIGYDTGVNYGQGQRVVKMIQEKVNKPISAVIYSHSHYIGGTQAYADASKTGLPKSLLGKAIRYALNLWPQLTVYLEDGNTPIDNNRAENAIRPFVIGRSYADFAIMRSSSPANCDGPAIY